MGHVGWAFRGVAEYEATATRYLADGAAGNERLMFVADDPDPARWPRHLLERGALMIASTADIYGADRVVDPPVQRELFVAALADAIKEGYAGMRVAADNTSLVGHTHAARAWTEWEHMGNALIECNPVNAICCFDTTRAAPETLEAIIGVHPARM